jgi:hypothetical protein
MHSTVNPNLTHASIAEAERFLKLLDPTATKFEFRTFDDNKVRKDKSLTRTFYGTLAEHFVELQRLNRKGAGVFVVINETDGKGRENENIVRVRAPHIDLDGTSLDKVRAAKVKPHLIIESSPQKWHVYWCANGMALDNFTPVQEALIDTFDSDPKVKALAGVMRLPGFYHNKAEPFLVHIVEILEMPPYPASYFKLREQSPRQRVRDDIEINPDKVIAALDAMPNDDVDEETWYRTMASAYVTSNGADEVYDAFVRWSKRSIKHDDRRTKQRWRNLRRKPPRKIGPGTLYYFANTTSPGWRETYLADAFAALTEQYAADVAKLSTKGGRHG